MKLPGKFASDLYWNIKKIREQGNIRDRLDFLLASQFESPEEIRKQQFLKLRGVIEHAYETVPYYRAVMEERGLRPDDIACFDDVRKLPLLSREVLRSKQEILVSAGADRPTLKANYSSGSTGFRASFQQDLNFRMWMRAHQLRTYMWCSGWKLGDPFILLWGSEIYWQNKTMMDKMENFLTNRREFNTFRLSQELIKKFLHKLRSFRPYLISTYSNAMHLMAMEAEKEGLKLRGLRAIQGTSEPMPPAFRQRISGVFSCEVFDKYGMRETNIVSHESPRHEEMCIQAENVYVEFLNEQGEACQYGEKGKLVITTLNNLSMPLIRYETSDLAAPVEGYCSSGIGLPRMTAVSGRVQDLILTPDGDHIDSYFFSYLLMRFEHVHWFQIVQTTIDRLYIRLYAPSGLPKIILEKINERILAHCGNSWKLEYEVLQEMPQSPTGKFRLCVSDLTSHYMKEREAL